MERHFTLRYVYNMKLSHIYFHEQLQFAYGEHSESFLVVFESHSAVVKHVDPSGQWQPRLFHSFLCVT